MLILFFTPFMVMSVNSWFSIWINIELNLIIFIGLIILNNRDKIYEISIKYYLINSFSSSIFVMIINLNLFYLNKIILLIINLIILIKLGIVPFHIWFIDLIINLNWINCLILSTWQKFIPFIILIFMYDINLLIIIILLRGLFRILYGINQINLKKIFRYSSINHMCWILFSLIVREILWLIYYFRYIIVNISLMYLFKILNLLNILDLFNYLNKFYRIIFIFIIFSLGGLPPFFGFLIKWYSIFSFFIYINYIIILLLIYYSLIYLYNYIRLCYGVILINFLNIKINYFILNKKFNIINNLSIIYLFILFSIINLFLIFFWLFY